MNDCDGRELKEFLRSDSNRISLPHRQSLRRLSEIKRRSFHKNRKKIIALEDLELIESDEPQFLLFDKMLDILGIHMYHYKIYLRVALFFLADGGEMLVLGIITHLIKKEWNLTSFQQGLIGSSIFVGFSLGAAISGMISDTKGRRPTMIAGCLIVTVFAILSSLATGFWSFLFLRALCGLGIGIDLPASIALASEVTPTYLRSKVLNWIWIFFPIGEVFVIVGASIFLDMENGWRYLLCLAALPCFIGFIIILFVEESPRFNLSNGYYEEAFENCIKIINGSTRKLDLSEMMETEEDKKHYQDLIINHPADCLEALPYKFQSQLIEEAENAESNKVDIDFRILLSEKFISLTIPVWLIFYIVSIVYYGVIYILPQTLNNLKIETASEENIYVSLIWSALSEIPSYLLAGIIADVPGVGRIGSMAVGFLFSIVFSFLGVFYIRNIAFHATMAKFAICFPFNVGYLYACEAYPTKIRSLGLGISNLFTRIGGITAPLLTQMCIEISNEFPFVILGFASVIGLIASVKLPFETMGRKIE